MKKIILTALFFATQFSQAELVTDRCKSFSERIATNLYYQSFIIETQKLEIRSEEIKGESVYNWKVQIVDTTDEDTTGIEFLIGSLSFGGNHCYFDRATMTTIEEKIEDVKVRRRSPQNDRRRLIP